MNNIFDAIGFIAGLVGLTLAAFSAWKSVYIQGLFRRPTWRAVESMVASIHKEMKDYTPSVIVGVGRGGAIAAAMISNRFRKTIPIIVLSINHKAQGEPLFDQCEPKEGLDKVLVITATFNSGDSMRAVVNKLRDRGAAEIKTGCLVRYTDAKQRIDYVGKERARRQLFPWMLNPTLFWSKEFKHQERSS